MPGTKVVTRSVVRSPSRLSVSLGSWAAQPAVVEERAFKLAEEAFNLAVSSVGDPPIFAYWRGIVDGIQNLLDDGTDSPLLMKLNGLSQTLRDL